MKIKYFAKQKSSSESVIPIELQSVGSKTVAKGLLQYMPSAFGEAPSYQLSIDAMRTPKQKKDFHAAWHGYTRIKPIKRARKRQIEKVRLRAMGPYGRKLYKAMRIFGKAWAAIAMPMRNKANLNSKSRSVLNRKRWK